MKIDLRSQPSGQVGTRQGLTLVLVEQRTCLEDYETVLTCHSYGVLFHDFDILLLICRFLLSEDKLYGAISSKHLASLEAVCQ